MVFLNKSTPRESIVLTMESSNPNEALLNQQPAPAEQTSEIAVPAEYIDDEKGKMNTLEVGVNGVSYG